MRRVACFFGCVGWLLMSLRGAAAADQPVDFNRDIRPILSNNCFFCHGPDEKERKGGGDGLRLDTTTGAFADLGGHAAVVKGKPEESELIKRVGSTDPDLVMPPPKSGKKLTAREVELLKQWVKQGAAFSKALVVPQTGAARGAAGREVAVPDSQSDRCLHSTEARTRGTQTGSRGRSLHAHSARVARFDRAAAVVG